MICELITNTLRHAQAQNITIDLHHDEKNLTLNYSDDGIGFDIENIPHKGMGLSNMESRIKSINGTFVIESSHKNGTHVSINIAI